MEKGITIDITQEMYEELGRRGANMTPVKMNPEETAVVILAQFIKSGAAIELSED